jgi:hypothetical protein
MTAAQSSISNSHQSSIINRQRIDNRNPESTMRDALVAQLPWRGSHNERPNVERFRILALDDQDNLTEVVQRLGARADARHHHTVIHVTRLQHFVRDGIAAREHALSRDEDIGVRLHVCGKDDPA